MEKLSGRGLDSLTVTAAGEKYALCGEYGQRNLTRPNLLLSLSTYSTMKVPLPSIHGRQISHRQVVVDRTIRTTDDANAFPILSLGTCSHKILR